MMTKLCNESLSPLDRFRGCLLGLACGDALGTTVEFAARDSFQPLTDMVGGGPFHLQPGQWTDDTSMALCLSPRVREIARGGFTRKSRSEIRGSGYCVESLEAALWCFYTTNSWREVVLQAVNLGDDADTTGAIAGQLAGAFYGASGIPDEWLSRLTLYDFIDSTARQLFERAMQQTGNPV